MKTKTPEKAPEKTTETKKKRASKGQRTHVRRMKQEAHNPTPVHK